MPAHPPKARSSPDLPAPFFDFAMSVLFVFVAFFMLSTMDTPKPAAGVVTPKAEFLVELTWNDGSSDDVDLYARGPDGKVVYFRNRTTGLMFLDHDNIGSNNTVESAEGGKVAIKDRRETVTIRAVAPGEYLFNAHAYRLASPNKLRLQVTKLNPYRVVTVAEANFDTAGQEQNLVAMTVNGAGEVTSVYTVPVKLVGG